MQFYNEKLHEHHGGDKRNDDHPTHDMIPMARKECDDKLSTSQETDMTSAH
tara:strand:+ start:1488 stop:1640 length:153 start_codon:yes stop_codon:yes gene_type:complete